MKAKFHGQVESGKLTLDKPERFAEYLKSLSGMVEIAIGKWHPNRSNQQNKYYWGVVVDMVSEEMGELPDAAHEILRENNLKMGIDHNGKRYEYVRSTTSLDTKEFEDYTERCRIWGSTELGIVIPEPNEVEV